MPSSDPKNAMADLAKVKYLQEGGIFTIQEIEKKDGAPWYKVGYVGKDKKEQEVGWINSVALLGQKLTVPK